jgi:hypothetical protein
VGDKKQDGKNSYYQQAAEQDQFLLNLEIELVITHYGKLSFLAKS